MVKRPLVGVDETRQRGIMKSGDLAQSLSELEEEQHRCIAETSVQMDGDCSVTTHPVVIQFVLATVAMSLLACSCRVNCQHQPAHRTPVQLAHTHTNCMQMHLGWN